MMRMRFLPVLLSVSLLSSPARPGEDDEAPDAGGLVASWIERVEGGGAVYPGGRQRRALEARGSEILPLLVDGFAHDDPRVGHALAALAALAAEKDAVPVLVGALADERTYVPDFAAIALTRLGATDAIPAITTAFRKSKLSLVTTMRALVGIGGRPAEATLQGFLAAYTTPTRAAAAVALGAFPTSSSQLVGALKDKEPTVRVAALEALARIGDASRVEAIRGRLRDEDEACRLAAVRALAAAGGKDAREALLRHFRAGRGERLEALDAAVALGAGPESAGVAYARGRLEDESVEVRLRAARILARAGSEEARTAVLEALGRETDPDAALALGRLAVTWIPEALPALRALTERFPARVAEALRLLDRAGDPELPDRLQTLDPDPEAAAGGPLFLLALHGSAEDRDRALALARKHPRAPGLLADAYLLTVVLGGPDTASVLARAVHRLPPEDLVRGRPGPPRLGLRALHVHALRVLSGGVFGYDPTRPDAVNRTALRRAIRWVRSTADSSPEERTARAVAEADVFLAGSAAGPRERALRILALAGLRDRLAGLLETDPSPAVRVIAARWLVEAGDPRGTAWLVSSIGAPALTDPTGAIDEARPTRLAAARALWRAANHRFVYGSEPLAEDVRSDLVEEEARYWRAWWASTGRRDPDDRARDGWSRHGIEIGESVETEGRALAAALAEDHPRFVKENALARLRAITGERMLPIGIVDLEILCPGEDHPVFEVLSPRWIDALGKR